jgi:uncharacterized membrane protein
MKYLFSSFLQNDKSALLAVMFLSALTMLPIWLWGIPVSYDGLHHQQFALIYYEAAQSGDFYPSLSSTVNDGYGDYGVRFYPPLPFLIMTAARFVTGNWYSGVLLAFPFLIILSSVGAYLWAREWCSPAEAVVAATLYAIAPHHLHQTYSMFFYGEITGGAVLPFAFWFVSRVAVRGRLIDICGLAATYAALILSHLPLAVLGSISLLIYGVTFFNRQSDLRLIQKLGSAVALGLAASAFYLVMMVAEVSWINFSKSEYSSGRYGYQSNFVLAFDYLSNPEAVERAMWFADLILLMTCLLMLPLVFAACFAKDETKKNYSRRAALLFLFALFMTTVLSRPLWDWLPVMHKVQFPWRWLAVASLFGAVAAAAGIEQVKTWAKDKNRRFAALLIVGGILVSVSFSYSQIIRQAVYRSSENFEQETTALIEAESFDCWWTIWTKNTAFQIKDKIVAADRKTEIILWTPEKRIFRVSDGNAPTVRVAGNHK